MSSLKFRKTRIRSASFDQATNRVDIVWSTGADVLRSDYTGNYVERLSMQPASVMLDRLNAGAAFLDTHDSSSLSNVIGSIVPGSARIEGGKGVATVQLSNAASDADTVGKIRDGIIRSISCGYMIHKSRTIASDDGGPPVLFVDLWEPCEISAVPIPADPGAMVRSRDGKRRTVTQEQRDEQAGAAMALRLLGSSAEKPASHKSGGGLIETAKRAKRAAEDQRKAADRVAAARRSR